MLIFGVEREFSNISIICVYKQMISAIENLAASENHAALRPLVRGITALEQGALFARSPRLYALLVVRFGMRPLAHLGPLVRFVTPLDLVPPRRLTLPALRATSHLDALLTALLGEPKQVFALRPSDFTGRRCALAARPPLLLIAEAPEFHAEFAAKAALRAVLSCGLGGMIWVQ